MDKDLLNALLEDMFPMEESTKYFKCLIYGNPGTGKTSLLAGIGNKVDFIEADPQGWESLFNHPHLVVKDRMIRTKYRGVSQLEAIAEALDEGIPQFSDFDTIMIDTGSNIANLDLDVVTKRSIDRIGRDRFNFDDDMWANYKQNAYRVRQAFLKLFMCDINVVMTAHAREVENKKTGAVRTVPDFSPKILAAINGMVSMIGYMTTSEAGVDNDGSVNYTRRLQVHPSHSIIAKTRIDELPVVIENIQLNTLRDVVDKWQAKGGKLLPEEVAAEIVPEELGVGEIRPAPNDNEIDNESSGFRDLEI